MPRRRWRRAGDEASRRRTTRRRPVHDEPWQSLRAGDRFQPEPFDCVPHRAEVVGCPHRSQLYALEMSPVELGLHEGGDIHIIDEKVTHISGHTDVHKQGVDNLDPAHVAVAKCRGREAGAREARTTERVGIAVLRCHRAIVPDLRCRPPHDPRAALTPTTNSRPTNANSPGEPTPRPTCLAPSTTCSDGLSQQRRGRSRSACGRRRIRPHRQPLGTRTRRACRLLSQRSRRRHHTFALLSPTRTCDFGGDLAREVPLP